VTFLNMMDQDSQHYWMAAAAAGAVALFALFAFFIRLRRDRLLADTPLVRIRSAAQGYVKVVGRATPVGSAPLPAPLSARPCVWWDYAIAEEVQDSRGNKRWRTVETATSVELFVLTDDDAQCLVGPVKAEITPTVRDVWYGSSPRPGGPPPHAASVFQSGGWRYTERLISDGARLSILGELRSHSEVGNVDAATAEKLRQWKQDQAGLLARFDKDHDGRIDAGEWEAARVAAAGESRTQTLQSVISRTSVISEPSDGAPFLIAALTTAQLETRERRFVGLYFVIGLLSVIFCAWAITHARLLAATAR
jgi:hypothetical protein